MVPAQSADDGHLRGRHEASGSARGSTSPARGRALRRIPGASPRLEQGVAIAISEVSGGGDLTKVASDPLVRGQAAQGCHLLPRQRPLGPTPRASSSASPTLNAPEAEGQRGRAAVRLHRLLRNPMRPTFAVSRRHRVSDLRLLLARGRRSPSPSICTRCTTSPGECLRVRLTGPGGASIPAKAWDIRYVRDLNKRVSYPRTGTWRVCRRTSRPQRAALRRSP